MFKLKGEFIKAEEHHLKALQIRKEIGDKKGEDAHYVNLGTVFHSLGKYAKAEECYEKALAITKEIGHKKGQAATYENLGVMFQSVGECVKAEEYFQKALQIRIEIGDKKGEASCYGNLGTVLRALDEIDKAKNFIQKALQIRMEIGDQQGIARDYEHQGVLFRELGEYDKAEEHLQKSLQIREKIGDQQGEAFCYGQLGTLFLCVGEYSKARKFPEKALELSYNIGDIELKFSNHLYLTLDAFFLTKNIHEAVSNLLESIKKSEEIRLFLRDNDQFKISFFDKHVSPYQMLSSLFCMTGKHYQALHVVELGRARALADLMSVRYGVETDIELKFSNHLYLTLDAFFLTKNIHEAVSNLLESIKKSEEIRLFLRDNDQFKISFFDKHVSPYQMLSSLFCMTGKHYQALHVVELGRARALADLMSVRYGVEIQISVDQESWVDIDKIMNESGHVCLYISYVDRLLFLWVIKRNKVSLFRQMDINGSFDNKEGERNVDEVFGDVTFRKFLHLSQGQYGDRSCLLQTSVI